MLRANARAPDVADEQFHVEGSNTLAHGHKARFKRLAASIVKLAEHRAKPRCIKLPKTPSPFSGLRTCSLLRSLRTHEVLQGVLKVLRPGLASAAPELLGIGNEEGHGRGDSNDIGGPTA